MLNKYFKGFYLFNINKTITFVLKQNYTSKLY